INYKYYSDIRENAIEMHKIRHDLNNILQSVYNIIYHTDGDETGEAMKLFEGLKQRAENLKIASYCPNELINAIVSAKKAECESAGINFEQSIQISADTGIEEVDLCRGICNMLDNAIEAQKDVAENKFVSFKISSDSGKIYISTTNSIAAEKAISKKTKTSKKDKKNHGFGMSIIDDIAKKYGGDFIITKNGSECMAVLELTAVAVSV
ncbi:MAG: GHKL domain-containing protein, partial [Ruminococcus sp.]|nr:GHKL domain-containing protein [Ruminococcus sp.]